MNYERIGKIRETMNTLKFDRETILEMRHRMQSEMELTQSLASDYARIGTGQPIRPRLGSSMPINYMRERQTMSFLLFPELMKPAYEIARAIGENICVDAVKGKSLAEIMRSNQPIAESHGYAFEEIVEADEQHAIYRHYECADCYGLPNFGMKICVYEAGVAAGMFSAALGKRVEVTETKCCANGDPYCEFLAEVMEE